MKTVVGAHFFLQKNQYQIQQIIFTFPQWLLQKKNQIKFATILQKIVFGKTQLKKSILNYSNLFAPFNLNPQNKRRHSGHIQKTKMNSYNQSLYDEQSNQHIPQGRQGNTRQSASQNNSNLASSSVPQFKIPEVEYLNPNDPSVNFKTQTLKLIQANAILTELIKDTLLEKYSVTEKIIEISEKIRRLENPSSLNNQNQSNQNIQQGGSQIMGNVSSMTGQMQKM